MDKNFLNIHVLISHSPSCLNRDDMNMQKSAVFGGKRRVRLSSQSLKRAIRHSDYYAAHLGSPSIRTRDLSRLSTRCLQALSSRFAEQTVMQSIEWIAGKEGLADHKELQADAVAPWVVEEIATYCKAIEEHRSAGLDDDRIKKQIDRDASGFRAALANGVDVALSGRMATSGLMTSIDGALAVAHAITTHSVDADIDWFTAVDDLVEDEGEVGAGHLNTQEFSSGVFYRYASLNLHQLQDNMGGASRDRALEIGAHLLYLFATVVPSAKQQSFAAHNVADLVLASFGDVPMSLANAFENPVRDRDGYLKPSAEALIRYWHKLQTAYSLGDEARLFCLIDDVEVEHQAPSLQALQEWVQTTVKSYLILKLKGPLQSWGTHTYEDYRPSSFFPTQSGLVGLLAACLGIERHDRVRFEALDQSIELAVRADHITLDDGQRLSPTKITDFHTIMNARRVDGRASRYPVVSRREYLCDATFTVAIRASQQPRISLEELEDAVKKPYYTPFLGRRSCPLSRPLWEQRLLAESFEQALEQVEPRRGVIYSEWIDFEHSRLQLRDVPLRSTRRQFAARYVNIKSVTTREGASDVSQ